LRNLRDGGRPPKPPAAGAGSGCAANLGRTARAGCLLAGLLVFANGRSASADSADDLARARDLFREGAALAERGDWKGALDRYERSAKIKRAALTLYNLGIAQAENGYLLDAIATFHDFLAEPVDPATARYVEPVRATVPKLEARLAHVEFTVTPKGTTVAVRVDGRELTTPAKPTAVDPGVHQIVAVAAGFGEVRETIALPEGGHAAVSLDLESRRTVAPSVVLPAALAVTGVTLLAGGTVMIGIGARAGLSRPDKSATNTLVAGSVVGGVGALVLGIGIGMLVRRPPRAAAATLLPWFDGRVGGLRANF
jgi:hypothetical protein